MGVPQGGILSPLLSNVILHEFDLYMEKRKLEFQTSSINQKPMIVNKKYTNLSTIIRKCKDNALPDLLREARRLRNKTRYELPNPKFTRIEYVRYADDWLIGIWGTKAQATVLKSEIALFLQSLKLTLSEEKTLITNTRRGVVKFLGTLIYKLTPTRGRLSHPTTAGNIRMKAPLKILADRLRTKGFWKPGKTGPKALGITNWIGWPIKELIHRFRAILNGLLNFYSFVDNRGSLAYIYYLLHGSLRNTICRKLNIGLQTFYSIYGPKISIYILRKKDMKWVELNFACPPLVTMRWNFAGEPEVDPLTRKDWKVSTLSALGQCCANCASTVDVEMHHLKHLKTMNAKLDTFGKMMASINRKQVPLCKPCHMKVHKGGNT